MNSGLSHAPCDNFEFLFVFRQIGLVQQQTMSNIFDKLICGGISFCKSPYCSISHLEAREYFGLCGNKAFSETMMCVKFFWTAPSFIMGELLLVVKDRALHATVDFRGLWLHIQKDTQICDASVGVSLKEIQPRVFEKYAFCISCLGFQDKAFSLILLVFPYTILTRAMNCLFVFPYMKKLRHYLVGVIEYSLNK